MIAPLLALLLMQQLDESASANVEYVDLGQPLSGSDYLLIAEAARHPDMFDADLSCYNIYVYDRAAARRVAFVAARDRVTEQQTETGDVTIYQPPDPNCRSISFVMSSDGRVAQVIRTRH